MNPPKTKVPRKTETKRVVGGKVYKAKINQKKAGAVTLVSEKTRRQKIS